MTTFKRYYPLSFLFLLYFGCASIIEEDRRLEKKIKTLPINKQTYCPAAKNLTTNLIGMHRESQKKFTTFLQLPSVRKLKFIDKSVLWSLLQMRIRPDLASPTARLQILINRIDGPNGKKFWDFASIDNQKKIEILKKQGILKLASDAKTPISKVTVYPYLKGLKELLKFYNSQHSLTTLAKILDKFYPSRTPANKDFALFLGHNSAALKSDPTFKKLYFKGDQIVMFNESLPQISFRKMVELFPTETKTSTPAIVKYSTRNYLFPFKSKILSGNSTIECNFDLKLYENSIYIINPEIIPAHIFGIESISGSSFLAVASQKVFPITSLEETPFWRGDPNYRTASMCFFNHSDNLSISLLSTNSRDPAQHIFHLLNYEIHQATSVTDLNTLIQFSRHLFLSNPMRLVIESHKASEQQIANLLKLNLPVYHAQNLGHIVAQFKNKNGHGLIIDDRKNNFINCP